MSVESGRIAARLPALGGDERKGLIIYLCAGDPDLETTFELVRALEGLADVIELGVPYTDPLADGPVIQAATKRALDAGTTPQKVLELVARLREGGCRTPIVLMGYYNPILSRGEGAWARACRAAGVDGLIVPDLPLEESQGLREACRSTGIDLIPLVAPTSSPERIEAICREASGFIYCVSLTGVTGTRSVLSGRFEGLVEEVRRHTGLPVAVGFGISSAGQVRQVAAVADAVIVGSAVVKLCGEGGGREAVVGRVVALVRELRGGLRSGTEQRADLPAPPEMEREPRDR